MVEQTNLSPEQLFTKLYELTFNDKELEAAQIMNVYITKGDILNIACDAIENNYNPFDLMHIFDKLQPKFELNMVSFIRFAKIIYNATINDGVAYKQYELFNMFLKNNEHNIKHIEIELKKEDKEFISGYVSTFYISLSEKELLKTHKYIIDELLHTKDIFIPKGYIGALSNINYAKNLELVHITISTLDKIRENAIFLNDCLYGYERLMKFDSSVSERFILYKDSKDPQVRQKLSYTLFVFHQDYSKEKWFDELLYSFTDTPIQHTGILHNLDSVLAHKSRTKNFDLVENFLHDWVIKISYSNASSSKQIYEIFSMTFSELIGEQYLLQKMILNFFNTDEYSLMRLASKIIEFHNLRSSFTFSFNCLTLSDIKQYNMIYITKKIIGYIHLFKSLCAIVFSILDIIKPHIHKDIIRFYFINYIGYEFPHSTVSFLQQKLVSIEAKQPKALYYFEIINNINDHFREIRSLPALNELRASHNRIYKIDKIMHSNMNKAYKESRKKSPLYNLFSEQIIKYGKGTFYFNPYYQKYSPPNNMASFSISEELPLSEVFSPIHAQMQRVKFITEKSRD